MADYMLKSIFLPDPRIPMWKIDQINAVMNLNKMTTHFEEYPLPFKGKPLLSSIQIDLV